ncbi:hypothetical protein V6N12_051107 [Hibiscus sabdariffa]|uniref:Uncharacterized protein n=1 Tax=Hibiscus sabdariffa TaxID=183260 RepID=A0ABR2GEC5_9ROSI
MLSSPTGNSLQQTFDLWCHGRTSLASIAAMTRDSLGSIPGGDFASFSAPSALAMEAFVLRFGVLSALKVSYGKVNF